MRRKSLPGIFALGCALVGTHGTQAAAYAFTKIADTSQGYSNFTLPAINSSGTVVFGATTGTTPMIFSAGSGAPVATVFDPTLTPSFASINALYGPSINDAGQIAFAAYKPFQGSGNPDVESIFRSSAGTVSQIFSAAETGGRYTNTAIDANGKVYFTLDDTSPSQIRSSDGTVVEQIGKFQAYTRPAVAANGTLGSTLDYTAGGNFQFAVYDVEINGSSYGNMFTSPGSPPPTQVTLTNLSSPDITSGGSIYFSASPEASGNYVIYIMNPSGNLSHVPIGVSAPPGTSYVPAVNDAGSIVALASNGSLLTGFGGLTDKIISVGDPLDGSTVTSLSFEHDGLSETNDVAFLATLADGRTGVFTTAVPEPSLGALALGAMMILRRRVGRSCA